MLLLLIFIHCFGNLFNNNSIVSQILTSLDDDAL